MGQESFSSPKRPYHLWGLPSIQFGRYRLLFRRGVKLATYLNVAPVLRICGSIPPFSRLPYVVHGHNFRFTVIGGFILFILIVPYKMMCKMKVIYRNSMSIYTVLCSAGFVQGW
jgi:hypothetical protein